MSIGTISASQGESFVKGKVGDEGSPLSCLEMALRAGLRICEELIDPEREAGVL
jgi:hypothetical protein